MKETNLKNLIFDSNPLLADRIQLSISIKFIVENDLLGKDFESYCQSIFNEYNKEKKNFNIRFDKVKRQYYIEVPEDFYTEKYPFFSHVRLRMNNPFTVTAEFNFIRFIREFAKDYKGFNKDYDLSVRIADDNYINKRVWKDWDSYLIKCCSGCIPDLAKKFADFIIKGYIEDFDRIYEIVTIKQIEFNRDFYVGCHKSGDVLHQLMYFIISSSGVEWVRRLRGYAISCYNAEKDNTEETRFYGDQYTPTLKFPVAKGIFFKIYRKTTDDIRFEITYQKGYIKRKYKKESFDFVYPRLRKECKDFFRRADFITILKCSLDNSYSDNFSIIDNLYNFLDLTYPELSSIADSVTYGNPISDPDIIRFIRGNKRLRNKFIRSYLGNGKRILIYDPINAYSFRKEKIIEYGKQDNLTIRLWRDYKRAYPNERVFVSRDGNKLIHKGV